MNTISIYLKPSGSVAELKKDFAMYVGAYQNKLIDVYVPKSILFENETGTLTNAVKIGGLFTAPNGEQIKTESYYVPYLTTKKVIDPMTNQEIEYAVYERLLPKELTVYEGTQQIVVNVVSLNTQDNTIIQVVTSQTCNLIVEKSAYLDYEQPLETNELDDVWGQINKNTQNIETIFNDFSIGENYIGQWSGTYIPTDEMLNGFVFSVEAREPRNGDTIIFILHIADETDKNYRIIYTNEGWQKYEIPPIEAATNTSLGIVKGTYSLGGTANTIVDIQNGEIVGVYVLDNNNTYKNVRDYMNLNELNIQYLQQFGATKSFVQDYSMPRLFNDVYFISANGYQNSVPTTPANGVQFTASVNNIGDFEIFSLVKDNTFNFELASKNGYKTSVFVSSNVSCEAMFRLTTEYKLGDNDWEILDVDITNAISFTPDNIKKIVFDSPFGYLGENVINLTNGDKIRQTLEVVSQDSVNKTFSVYSNEIYPSNFYFTSQSFTATSGGGTENYNDLLNKPTLNTNNTTSQIPSENETVVGSINLHKVSKTGALADTISDSLHRTVTDDEKTTWNNKSNFNGSFNNLTDVPQASTSQAGIIEIATDGEAETGTNQTKAVNPKQLKTAIQSIGSVFTLKGSVQTASQLPSSGNKIGDVYYVIDESVGYVWLNDGTTNRWEQLGLPIDLSTYLQLSDVVNNLTSNAIDKPLSAYQGYVLNQAIASLASNSANKDGSNLSQSNIDAWKTLLGINSSDLSNYIKFSDIVNNLNGTADKPLSAYQGYVLDQSKADKSTTYTKTEVDTLIQGFITNTANDLVNYYTKSQTYNKTEIDNLVSAIPKFDIEVVNSLPTTNISDTTIYLVRNSSSSGNDLYTEFIYVNGSWENLGSQTLDISGYVTTQQLNTALANYYTSSQVDTLLSGKASQSDLNTLTNTVNSGLGSLQVLFGVTVPSTATVASAGQFYYVIPTKSLYMCEGLSGSTYSWKLIGGDDKVNVTDFNSLSSAVSQNTNYISSLSTTVSGHTTSINNLQSGLNTANSNISSLQSGKANTDLSNVTYPQSIALWHGGVSAGEVITIPSLPNYRFIQLIGQSYYGGYRYGQLLDRFAMKGICNTHAGRYVFGTDTIYFDVYFPNDTQIIVPGSNDANYLWVFGIK